MSRLKKIEGLLTFGDDVDFEKFERTISQLRKRFTPIAPAQEIALPAVPVPGAKTPAAGVPAIASSAPSASALFIVTLTFEESYTKPVYQKIWEVFEENLPKLEEAFLKIAGAFTPG